MKLYDSIFRPQEFTGRHMLAVIGLFFGTIIGVNLVLAYFASASWSGLIVRNTYVASQQFNELTLAEKSMRAKGWSSQLTVDGSTVSYRLSDAAGAAVSAESVVVRFQRPVNEIQDSAADLVLVQPGFFVAEKILEPGQWMARIEVVDGGTPIYHESLRILVDEKGVMR